MRATRGVLLGCLVLCGSACRTIVDNDNRAFGGNGDRFYTSGVRFEGDIVPGRDAGSSWVTDVAVRVSDRLAWVDEALPGPHERATTLSTVVGQQIYTPEFLGVPGLIQSNRPYAAWLYAGVVRIDSRFDPDPLRRRDVETAVELDLGIVGPYALGEQGQKAFHELLGMVDAKGWNNQLGHELGVVLAARRDARWAYLAPADEGGLAVDAINSLGASLGNVDTHASVGASLRAGWNLPRSLDHARGDRLGLLAASHAEPVDTEGLGATSVFGFVDVEGRLVLRNIFLDGNTFRSSHDVDKESTVDEIRFGLVWQGQAWSLGYTWVARSSEYETQSERQRYGSLVLAFREPF